MKLSIIVSGLLSLWLVAGDSWAEGEALALVVNKSNSVSRLSKDELRQIFQTTKTSWPGGETIEPLNLPEADAVRQEFDRAVLGLEPDRVARYWMDRKIRGDARPPKKVASVAAAIRSVTRIRGAIAYIPAREVNAEVKVVAKLVSGKVQAP